MLTTLSLIILLPGQSPDVQARDYARLREFAERTGQPVTVYVNQDVPGGASDRAARYDAGWPTIKEPTRIVGQLARDGVFREASRTKLMPATLAVQTSNVPPPASNDPLPGTPSQLPAPVLPPQIVQPIAPPPPVATQLPVFPPYMGGQPSQLPWYGGEGPVNVPGSGRREARREARQLRREMRRGSGSCGVSSVSSVAVVKTVAVVQPVAVVKSVRMVSAGGCP